VKLRKHCLIIESSATSFLACPPRNLSTDAHSDRAKAHLDNEEVVEVVVFSSIPDFCVLPAMVGFQEKYVFSGISDKSGSLAFYGKAKTVIIDM